MPAAGQGGQPRGATYTRSRVSGEAPTRRERWRPPSRDTDTPALTTPPRPTAGLSPGVASPVPSPRLGKAGNPGSKERKGELTLTLTGHAVTGAGPSRRPSPAVLRCRAEVASGRKRSVITGYPGSEPSHHPPAGPSTSAANRCRFTRCQATAILSLLDDGRRNAFKQQSAAGHRGARRTCASPSSGLREVLARESHDCYCPMGGLVSPTATGSRMLLVERVGVAPAVQILVTRACVRWGGCSGAGGAAVVFHRSHEAAHGAPGGSKLGVAGPAALVPAQPSTGFAWVGAAAADSRGRAGSRLACGGRCSCVPGSVHIKPGFTCRSFCGLFSLRCISTWD